MRNENEVLSQAIQRYGMVAQVNMVFEEMSELQKELCKQRRVPQARFCEWRG